MELITKAQIEQLLANGRAQRAAIDQDAGALDFNPVVRVEERPAATAVGPPPSQTPPCATNAVGSSAITAQVHGAIAGVRPLMLDSSHCSRIE